MILKYLLFTVISLIFSLSLFSQVKLTFNNVDTISPLNREIIGFFEEYINHRTKGEDFSDYWYTAEKLKFPMLDTYEKWIYQLYKHSPQTILGLSKLEDDVFKIKVMLESPNEGDMTMLYAIQNFLVRKTEKGFKLQDMLGYQLEKGNYTVISDTYFDFYLPENMHRRQKPISAINDYIQKIENYFDRKIPAKLRYVYAPSCEELNRLRGYDYVANMMSTKTSVCGLTDSKNLVMYSSYPGVHKHELLRLLLVLFPKYPPVLMDGFTNLAGGSMGKPISYHLRKIAPHLLANPHLLDDISSFYYYDDETNPHFVFHALATNYFIKLHGEDKLKEYMKRDDLTGVKLESFLQEHCQVTDVKAFFLEQLTTYGTNNMRLEFEDML